MSHNFNDKEQERDMQQPDKYNSTTPQDAFIFIILVSAAVSSLGLACAFIHWIGWFG